MSSLPVGLPLCRSETPAWTKLPPWTSCSRRIPRPPASAGAATDRPAAARQRSTDTCRSPTWMDLPTPLFCRTAAGVSKRKRIRVKEKPYVSDFTYRETFMVESFLCSCLSQNVSRSFSESNSDELIQF